MNSTYLGAVLVGWLLVHPRDVRSAVAVVVVVQMRLTVSDQFHVRRASVDQRVGRTDRGGRD